MYLQSIDKFLCARIIIKKGANYGKNSKSYSKVRTRN